MGHALAVLAYAEHARRDDHAARYDRLRPRACGHRRDAAHTCRVRRGPATRREPDYHTGALAVLAQRATDAWWRQERFAEYRIHLTDRFRLGSQHSQLVYP